MNASEYKNAKRELPKQWQVLVDSRNISAYRKELQKFLELLITVKGHAWCMDVKSERKKMAKLIAESVALQS